MLLLTDKIPGIRREHALQLTKVKQKDHCALSQLGGRGLLIQDVYQTHEAFCRQNLLGREEHQRLPSGRHTNQGLCVGVGMNTKWKKH